MEEKALAKASQSILATRLVALITKAIEQHGDMPVYVGQEWVSSLDGLTVEEEGKGQYDKQTIFPKRIELY